MNKEKFAFTLAELLIVIGTIGIISAITIPNLIHNIQSKILESQFKHSVSLIHQVIKRTKIEMGIDELSNYCTAYDDLRDYYNAKECMENLYSNMINSGNKKMSRGLRYDIDRSGKIQTYNGKKYITNKAMSGNGDSILRAIAMPDGTYFNMNLNGYVLFIGIDINGSGNPNKFGHDIFRFRLNSKDELIGSKPISGYLSEEDLNNMNFSTEYERESYGNPCNIESNQEANGVGCAWYALKDICPQSGEKGYFKCLPK